MRLQYIVTAKKKGKTKEMAEKVKLVYTPKEAAAVLGIGVQNVYALIHSAKQSGFPVIKISSMRFLIPCQKMSEWIETAAACQYGLDIEY